MDDLDRVLRALSHHIRREILWLVWERPLPAGALADHFDVAPATVSQHLKTLHTAGLVEVIREGTWRYYKTRREVVQKLRGGLPASDAWPARRDEGQAVARRGTCQLEARIRLTATPQQVFDAWTVPEEMTWAGEDPHVQAVPGGTFDFVSPFGGRVQGVYEQVAAPSFLLFHWDFSDGGPPLPLGQNLTLVTLSPAAEGTELHMLQWVYEESLVPVLERVMGVMLERLGEALGAMAAK